MNNHTDLPATNHSVAQPTDWAAVRSYYLECRSYKLTGTRFGISPQTIKMRAYREKWAQSTAPEVTSSPTLVAPEATPKLQHEATASPIFVAPEATPEPQHEATQATASPILVASKATQGIQHEATRATSSPILVAPEATQGLQRNTSGVSTVASAATSNSLGTLPSSPSFIDNVQLPMLPNLSSHMVEMGRPWEAQIIAHEKLPTKEVYRAYLSNIETRDCAISGIRGIVTNLRVNRDNPAAALLAVVADYDVVMTDAERAKRVDKMLIKPNFVSTSYSGGTHAVWLLECPIPILPGGEFYHFLANSIKKELRLARAFGALDENAFDNSSQYYHAGWNWKFIHSSPIAESRCLRWFSEAMNKTRMGDCNGVVVPLSRVREEINKRFPGRWNGDFELGSRGCRFWDRNADNPTAAIVHERGMVCFTGPFPFRSWADIFGREFVDDYRDERIGQVLKDFYCVGNNFYALTDNIKPDGSIHYAWTSQNRQNIETRLAKRYGFSTKADTDGAQSEVKDMIGEIMERNTMEAAIPLIYKEPGKTILYGKPVLNTSFLKVHPPDLSLGKSWGDGFPWIAAFMEGLFPDNIQRERFMAAWAYAYRNAYHGHPRNGHTIFIAGERGVGKNFLTECLYGASMGGYSDASDYVLGTTRFNARLFEVGVWTLNDTVTKGNPQERSIFSKFLKKLAANHQHIFEGKFKDSFALDWQGRILVTLNTDPMSLAILPDIDINNTDKISLFKTSDKVLDDKDAAEHARKEMGALCSFLLNWELPEHCIGNARWGVRNYLHADLAVEASNSGSTASFGEILSLFVRESFASDRHLECLEGSATWFLQQLLMSDTIREMLRGTVSANSIGKHMGALAASGSFPLHYKRCHGGRLWWITRKEFEAYTSFDDFLDPLCPF